LRGAPEFGACDDDSIAKKRFAAALDPSFLEEIWRGDGIVEER
jgi:hypothetical protein